MKRYITLLIILCTLLPLLFIHGCANTTQAPTGGDKDTIPPLIIDIKPLPGAINVPVHGAKIVFTFNEYVTIKTAKNIFLSPPQEKAPKSKVRDKSIVVSFEEDLLPNTTYTLSLSDAIADNNEGNMFPGYSYVFSTGEKIDSMLVTGTVLDCNTLKPVKDATVMLYKDHSDSALFLHRPYAAAKTDDWGYFAIPFIQDTLYRIYAIKDQAGNNIYDPDTDLVGFVDSIVKPVMTAVDTLPEMLKYDPKDTLECQARRSEHEINIFREKPTKQYIVNKVRVADRTSYITFMAPNAYIDSLWIRGYSADRIITQFNLPQDSLEIWVNDRKEAPDTLHLFVNYRKTDSLGVLRPSLEHIRLAMENGKKTLSKKSRKDIKHEDTTCVFKLEGAPETVEQNGYSIEFTYPIIKEDFSSVKFRMISPRQKETLGKLDIKQDSLNIRRYILRPTDKLQLGYEYILKIPARCFRDINGFWSDSTELKLSLPNDDALSSLAVNMEGVDRKIIVDLLDEKGGAPLRSYIIDKPEKLLFPYLKEGSYSIRVTDDGNRNSMVDTGSLLEHRQPEKVRFYMVDGKKQIKIPAGSEVEQAIDIKELFK